MKAPALLLALGKPKGAPDEDEESGGDDLEAAAAEDIMAAIKDDDAKALREALHGFVSACMSSYDKDEDGE